MGQDEAVKAFTDFAVQLVKKIGRLEDLGLDDAEGYWAAHRAAREAGATSQEIDAAEKVALGLNVADR